MRVPLAGHDATMPTAARQPFYAAVALAGWQVVQFTGAESMNFAERPAALGQRNRHSHAEPLGRPRLATTTIGDNRALDDSERVAVEAYLLNKYLHHGAHTLAIRTVHQAGRFR